MNEFLRELKQKNLDTLLLLGFKYVNVIDDIYKRELTPTNLILYPDYYFDLIPNGTEIVTIHGEKKYFDNELESNDSRYRVLSFGFIYEKGNNYD